MFSTKITLTRKIFFAVFMLSAFQWIFFTLIARATAGDTWTERRRSPKIFVIFFEFLSGEKNFSEKLSWKQKKFFKRFKSVLNLKWAPVENAIMQIVWKINVWKSSFRMH